MRALLFLLTIGCTKANPGFDDGFHFTPTNGGTTSISGGSTTGGSTTGGSTTGGSTTGGSTTGGSTTGGSTTGGSTTNGSTTGGSTNGGSTNGGSTTGGSTTGGGTTTSGTIGGTSGGSCGDCVSCCVVAHPAGYQQWIASVQACECTGLVGNGTCAVRCLNSFCNNMDPDADCGACVQGDIDRGVCVNTVFCSADVECTAWLSCAEAC